MPAKVTCVDNSETQLRCVLWDVKDYIDLTWDTHHCNVVCNTVIHFRVVQDTGKFLRSCTTGSLSRRSQLHGLRLYTFYTPSQETIILVNCDI